MMNWLSGARKLVAAAVAVGAAFGCVNSAHAQVAAGSGSYATAWETPIYNDNGFFGPTVASMSSAYSTLYLDASLKTKAIPTDQWWTDLMFGFRGSGTWTQHAPWNTQLWSFPQLVEPTAQGMVIYFPNSWNPRSGAAEAFNFGTPVNISGTTNGHGFTANNPVVKSYGDWTVSYAETDNNGGGTITTTLARGIPFTWVQYSNVTPTLAGGAFYDVNGTQITGTSYTGSAVATVVGGETFGIYAAPNTVYSISGANISIPSPYVVYAVLPDKTYLSTFAQWAYAMPTGSQMTYTYNRAAGQIQTSWNVTTTSLNGTGTATLQGWLPHHYRTTTNNLSFQTFTYLTPRGTMKMAAGNTFTINWPFRGIAPVLPAPHTNNAANDYSPSRMQTYVDSFASAHPGFAGDSYAQGQELGLGAQFLTMADQLGLTADKTAIQTNLENVMNDWYKYTPGEGGANGSAARYFVRDTKYGSFVGNVPGFGSESYNDNHFHYGYFLTAAALTGMKDSTWLNSYSPLISMIAKDYGNWDRTDTTYPYLRHFDIWEGHCWANGISTPNGENQESSSESMQSWVGLFMLGNMAGNSSMADAGAMGYAIEPSAVNEYWQDWKKTNFPAGYGANGAGQVTGGQILYSTNFGADPAWIYAIQFCPTNHWNNYLVRDTTYAASVLNNLWSERSTAASQGLFTLNDANNGINVFGARPGDYLLGYQELYDPSTVAQEMDSYWTGNLGPADDGEMSGPVYYIAHSLRWLGLQDTNYWTNIPTSQIYFNASTGYRTAIIYNPQSSAQTATIYNNGAVLNSVSVPAQTQIAVILTSGTGAPIPPTGIAGTPANNQVTVSWIEPSTLPSNPATSYNLYRSTTAGGEGTTPYKTGLTSTSYADTAVTNGTTYFYKVAAVNASGTSALSGEASCVPATPPSVFTDPLNDFSLVGSKSANWGFDTTNTAFFNGDASRADRTVDDTEYLVYNQANIVGFNVKIFFLGGNTGQISFFVSTNNGSTWTSVPTLNGVAAAGQQGWYYFNLSNNGALPAGVTNFKVQIAAGSGNAWDPQISQVQLYYTSSGGGAPSTPTGVTATPGNAQVSLGWTASTGATSYNIYRSTTQGAEGTTVFATSSTNSYVNTGLTNGTTYYYKVAAVNAAGSSAQSTEVNATPNVVPGQPTGLAATAGNAQVALSWTATSGATSYNVYRSTTAGGEGSTPIGTSNTNSYTSTGLTNGTKYFFTVAAVNSAGPSIQSAEVNATPQVPLPGAPGSVTATAGNSQVALSWTAGSNAATYNVYRGTTSGAESPTPIATGITATNYTNTGLTNGTKYFFTVASVNAAGSTQSSEVNAIPVAGQTVVTDPLNDWTISSSHTANWALDASNPTFFNNDTSRATRTVDDAENIVWSFSGITTFNAQVYIFNGPVTVATFWYSTNSGSTWTQATVTYGTETMVASGWGYYNVVPSAALPAGVTNLKVQFTSGTGNAWDPQLAQIQITYGGGVSAPPTPTGLVATPGNAQASLTWNASSGATSYNIYRSTTQGGEGTTVFATSSTNSYTNTGLTNGTTYYYKVAAVNSAGASAQSSEASALPNVAPGQPTGLVAAGGNAQVQLNWAATSGATSYNIYRSTTAGAEGTTVFATSGTNSYLNTGLTNGTQYYYKVAAVNSAGSGIQSAEGSAIPIAPPSGLSATAGNAQVSLSWTGSTGAASYNIYRGTTAGGESATAIATGVTSTSYINTGLTNGTTYFYKVAAINATTTSGQSNEASATPAAASNTVLQIACGNSAVGSWVADTDFSGGAVSSGTTNAIDTSAVTNPAPTSVYQHGRKGTCTYTIPGLTAGSPYTVRLHFCEYAATGAGQRTFNVSINGTQVLTNFDIFATAGAEFKANVQAFTTTANASGQIVIVFTTVLNNALVAGIEIVKSAPLAPTGLTATAGDSQVALSWTGSATATSYNVYRGTSAGGESATAIATGVTGSSYTNTGLTNGTKYYYKVAAVSTVGTGAQSNEASATPAGSTSTSGAASINCGGLAASPFVADADFSGGSSGSTASAVATPFVSAPIPPQAVLQSWRTGAFTYTMPGFTAGTSHTVSLYFMEPTATAAGQRNFNVLINGTQVLTNFDVWSATGGQLKAIQENFIGTANASGQIVVQFTNGTVGSPIIEGIAVN